MSEAICFKCGALKRSAFVTCTNCQAHPASETEEVLSVVLSDQCLGAIDLAACAEDIRCKRRLVLDPRKIEQAKAAMKDPQFRASLGAQEDAIKLAKANQDRANDSKRLAEQQQANALKAGKLVRCFQESTFRGLFLKSLELRTD